MTSAPNPPVLLNGNKYKQSHKQKIQNKIKFHLDEFPSMREVVCRLIKRDIFWGKVIFHDFGPQLCEDGLQESPRERN